MFGMAFHACLLALCTTLGIVRLKKQAHGFTATHPRPTLHLAASPCQCRCGFAGATGCARQGGWPLHRHRDGRCGRRPTPAGRAAFFRAGFALRAVPRLGNPALRQLQPPSGFDQRATGHAVAHQSAPQGRWRRCGVDPCHHRAVSAGAACFSGRLHLSLQAGAKAG